jgi:hypothetical protein
MKFLHRLKEVTLRDRHGSEDTENVPEVSKMTALRNIKRSGKIMFIRCQTADY